MFKNREDAGNRLAATLEKFSLPDPIIYALPRGGVPVAAAAAHRLQAPLDLMIVRKLGAPGRPEAAIGAVVDSASPTVILHNETVQQLNISRGYVDTLTATALDEIDRRREIYFKGRKPLSPKNRIAIIIDDGLATGATMEAAVKAMRKAGPSKIIVAVPTAPGDAVRALSDIADDVICLETPAPFWSVSSQYDDFRQLTDEDVIDCLNRNATAGNRTRPASAQSDRARIAQTTGETL